MSPPTKQDLFLPSPATCFPHPYQGTEWQQGCPASGTPSRYRPVQQKGQLLLTPSDAYPPPPPLELLAGQHGWLGACTLTILSLPTPALYHRCVASRLRAHVSTSNNTNCEEISITRHLTVSP